MLCRWSLAIQQYDFKIFYRKGSSNSNADALSRLTTQLCTVTIGLSHYSPMELRASQSTDVTLSAILQARLHSANAPQGARWNKPPLYRYKQI